MIVCDFGRGQWRFATGQRGNLFWQRTYGPCGTLMNRILSWHWLQLGVVGLLLLSFIGCQSADSAKDKKALAAAPRSVPVGIASAVKQDMPVYLTGLGSVTAYNTVSLKSRVDGQLLQVNFKEGQKVNKGDLLVL